MKMRYECFLLLALNGLIAAGGVCSSLSTVAPMNTIGISEDNSWKKLPKKLSDEGSADGTSASPVSDEVGPESPRRKVPAVTVFVRPLVYSFSCDCLYLGVSAAAIGFDTSCGKLSSEAFIAAWRLARSRLTQARKLLADLHGLITSRKRLFVKVYSKFLQGGTSVSKETFEVYKGGIAQVLNHYISCCALYRRSLSLAKDLGMGGCFSKSYGKYHKIHSGDTPLEYLDNVICSFCSLEWPIHLVEYAGVCTCGGGLILPDAQQFSVRCLLLDQLQRTLDRVCDQDACAGDLIANLPSFLKDRS